MDEGHRRAIRDVKASVLAMLREREGLPAGEMPIAQQSRVWSEACSYFDYMLWLPEEAYENLRPHTYHFTGDTYHHYTLHKGEADFWQRWRRVIDTLPEDLILYEAEGVIPGMGFRAPNGRLVSRDVLVAQRVVRGLHEASVLDSLRSRERPMLLEIGSGYGCLLHHLRAVLGGATCVIVDLPESLLFSGAYLSLMNPGARVYLYDRETHGDALSAGRIAEHDFVLLPNYRLDALRHLRFDLSLNVDSLQEMRADQVEVYLDFVAATCRGVFYSRNQDRLPENTELQSLHQMIAARFTVEPAVEFTPPGGRGMGLGLRESLRSLLGLGGRRPDPNPTFRTLLCRPRAPG